MVQGTIISYDEAGGIAGGGRDATINGCFFMGSVRATNGIAGGIIGRISLDVDGGSIVNCISAGEIDSLTWQGV